MLKKTVNLFGIEITDISLSRSIELARVSLLSGESRVFFTPNLEMLQEARKSKEIRDTLNRASVLLPDGVGVLMVSKIVGTQIENKVAGIDFGEKLLALAEKENATVFLLGGKTGVAKKAAIRLLKKHPKLKICGIHCGYFNEDQESEIVKKIKRANPDILIVCMGFPKQEHFVCQHKNDFLDIKVITCLGGAIDVWSGRKKRAPKIWQKAHLEWAWRIMGDPRRTVRFVSSLPALFHAAWN